MTVIKYGRLRWVQHVLHVEELRNAYEIWSRTLKGRDNWGETDVSEGSLLKWMLKVYGKSVDWNHST